MFANVPEAAAFDDIGIGLNGHQELLADPSRPVVYWGDDVGYLHVLNYSSGGTTLINLGREVRSLDLRSDGKYLAVASVSAIHIVDLRTEAIDSILPLDIEPRSIRYGNGDRLFVSDWNSNLVKILNSATGTTIGSFDAGRHVVLEIDDDGNTLLAFSQGSETNTSVSRYSIATDTPLLLDSTDELGQFFSQAVVDWANGTFYLACSSPFEVQVRSIASLEKIGSYPIPAFPTGIALSRDGKTIYGVSCHGGYDYEGSSVIYAYDVLNSTLLSIHYVHSDLGPIAPTDDPNKVALVAPLRLETIGPTIVPERPAPGSVYAYTPGYLTFNVESYVTITPENVTASIDNFPYEVASPDGHRFEVNITQPLSVGQHEIEIKVWRGSWTVVSNWSFTIDPDHAGAIAPSLTLLAPLDGASLSEGPVKIEIAYTEPTPPPLASEVSIIYDGTRLATYQDPSERGHYYSLTPSTPSPNFTIAIVGEIDLDTATIQHSWSITCGNGPILYAGSPAPGSYLGSSPDQITAEVYLGDPASTINPASLTVKIDNDIIPSTIDVDQNIVANLANPLSSGVHQVHITLDTSSGPLEVEWSFTIAPPGQSYQFIRTYYGPDFNMLTPSNWTVSRDQPLGNGLYADLKILGPTYGDVTTNVLTQSEFDPEARGDLASIHAFANATMAGLGAKGYGVGMIGQLNYTKIANLTAGIWHMRYYGYGMIQTMALVVDEDNGQYWLITCTVAEGASDYVWPTFETMITSIQINRAVGTIEQKYHSYERVGDFDLLVPDGWIVKEEVTSGNTTFSLSVTGPRCDGFTANILLQNGTDPSIREDRAYLTSQVADRFIQALRDQGVEATLYGDPVFTTISNHTTMIVTIKWTSLAIIQKTAFIVDELHHRFWIFTCSAAESSYKEYSDVFDTVIESYNVTNVTSNDNGDMVDIFSSSIPILAVGGCAVVALAVAVVLPAILRRRKDP